MRHRPADGLGAQVGRQGRRRLSGVVLRNLLDTLEEDLHGMKAREGRYTAWAFWLYRVEAPIVLFYQQRVDSGGAPVGF